MKEKKRGRMLDCRDVDVDWQNEQLEWTQKATMTW
jgi:hypothetical protein